MGKKQIVESKKKTVGNHALFRDNQATIILKKLQNTNNVWYFLSNFNV